MEFSDEDGTVVHFQNAWDVIKRCPNLAAKYNQPPSNVFAMFGCAILPATLAGSQPSSGGSVILYNFSWLQIAYMDS